MMHFMEQNIKKNTALLTDGMSSNAFLFLTNCKKKSHSKAIKGLF